MSIDAKTVMIRKVKILKGRAKIECDKQHLKPDDLVLLTSTYYRDSLPDYTVEKVEGDPVSFLLKRAQSDCVDKTSEEK